VTSRDSRLVRSKASGDSGSPVPAVGGAGCADSSAIGYMIGYMKSQLGWRWEPHRLCLHTRLNNSRVIGENKADHRPRGIERPGIHIQDIFQGGDEGRIGVGRDLPFQLQSGFEFVFLASDAQYRGQSRRAPAIQPVCQPRGPASTVRTFRRPTTCDRNDLRF
jgi:hypothetical protein